METQTPPARSGTLELRDYFRILWVRKWTILFVTAILLFVAQNPDPRHAADLAHYFATSYVELHKQQVLTPFTEQLKLAQSQLQSDNESLDQIGPFRAAEPSAVTQQRSRLTADLA